MLKTQFSMWSLSSMFFVGAFFWFDDLRQCTDYRNYPCLVCLATAAAPDVPLFYRKLKRKFYLGHVSDKISRSKTLYIILHSCSFSSLAIIAFVPGQIGFVVGIVGLHLFPVWWCISSHCHKITEPVNQGVKSMELSDYSIAAYLAPSIAVSDLQLRTRGISPSPLWTIVLALVGIVLNVIYR